MDLHTARHQYREVLAGLAAKTQAKLPALNGRVTKACKLVLGHDVELHPDGTALVNSLTDPTRAYQVTGAPATCQCQDYDHAPEHLCAHRLAVGFQRKVQELLPPAPESGPEVHPVCTSPLPEAPVSITLKATLHGHEVLVTLRGHDFASVKAQVEQASQWLQSQTPPPSTLPQETEKRYCPRHGCEMTLNHKDGRSWWSHKTAEGWCKGK
jgi:hypothetical protein